MRSGSPPSETGPYRAVDAGEEGGERLAGACGRGDQRMLSLGDGRPSAGLRFGGASKLRLNQLSTSG